MANHSQFLEGWLASEQASHDIIGVKRVYIDINGGNVFDGLMFSQIMFWHGLNKETKKPRMTIERDGELWLAKSYDDWWEECRINKHTARQCIDRIAARGLIVKKLWKFNGTPTVHIRIDLDALETHIKSICYPISNPIDIKPQMEMIPDVKSLTETTTNTTTKTPNAKPRYTDLIKAWLDVQGSKNNGAYKNAQIQASAKELWDSGITAEDVTAYTIFKKGQSFWKDKFVGFNHVADEILSWKEKTKPQANGKKSYNAFEDTELLETLKSMRDGTL